MKKDDVHVNSQLELRQQTVEVIVFYLTIVIPTDTAIVHGFSLSQDSHAFR